MLVLDTLLTEHRPHRQQVCSIALNTGCFPERPFPVLCIPGQHLSVSTDSLEAKTMGCPLGAAPLSRLSRGGLWFACLLFFLSGTYLPMEALPPQSRELRWHSSCSPHFFCGHVLFEHLYLLSSERSFVCVCSSHLPSFSILTLGTGQLPKWA